jgi:hypothetical protein
MEVGLEREGLGCVKDWCLDEDGRRGVVIYPMAEDWMMTD